MAIKWVVSDVDGCLTSEASVAFDLAPLGRLAAMARTPGAMPPMTLCTGRPQPYVEALLKYLGIMAPAICENGAVIYSLADNTARYGPGVTPEKLRDLRIARGFLEDELLPRHPGVVMQFGKEAQLSAFSANAELLPPVARELTEWVERRGLHPLDIKASHFYLNVSMEGVTKGSALAWLLEHELHASREEVAGIGDTTGDVPLREASGFFACPANAQEELKPLADYVSPHAEIDGVMDILAYIQARGRD